MQLHYLAIEYSDCAMQIRLYGLSTAERFEYKDRVSPQMLPSSLASGQSGTVSHVRCSGMQGPVGHLNSSSVQSATGAGSEQ